MNSISSFIFILLLTLCPYQIVTANAANGPDLITKTCDHTLFKDLCKASLQSGSNGNHASSVYDLAVLALKVASKNATSISNQINQLLKAKSNPIVQQCLADCSENYMDAIDRIKDSIAALGSKRYSDANTWVTAAMSGADSCQDGFNDQPDHKSPLTAKNTVFSQLCSNALAITNLLSRM